MLSEDSYIFGPIQPARYYCWLLGDSKSYIENSSLINFNIDYCISKIKYNLIK